MTDPLSITIPLDNGAQRPPAPTRFLLKPSPDHPDDYIWEVDYSTLSKFMVCPRSVENYAVRHREAQRDYSAQNFGRLFHSLEEKRLLVGWTPELDATHAEQIATHFMHYPPSPEDHRTSGMMHTVLNGYKTRYKNDGLEKRVVVHNDHPFVERPFKIPLTTIEVKTAPPYSKNLLVGECLDGQKQIFIRNIHVIYVGRIDSLFTDESKLYWVRDIKTSSRGGDELFNAFRLSLQTRGYCWAAQKILGKSIAGLMLDAVVVRKPTKTGKNLEYNRQSYFYSPDLIDEWEDDMKAHVTAFVSCLVRGFFPQTSLSFKSPCPSCDYFENCTLPRKQRGADLQSEIYRDVTWNPMLIE